MTHLSITLPDTKPGPYRARRDRRPLSWRNKATGDWTPEKEAKLVHLWAEGWSCSKVAEALGGSITRSAVAGKVRRMKLPFRRTVNQLDRGWAVHDARVHGGSKPKATKPPKVAKPKAEKRQPGRPPKPIAVAKSNIPRAVPAAKSVVVALPVPSVSDADLVKGWLAQNGGARKFERGDSGEILALQLWLRDRGYTLVSRIGHLTLKRDGVGGRPKRMTHKAVIAFVDELRVAEGLARIAA